MLELRSYFFELFETIFWLNFSFATMKRIAIICNKNGIYKLPHELPNDLRPGAFQKNLKATWIYSPVPSILPKILPNISSV